MKQFKSNLEIIKNDIADKNWLDASSHALMSAKDCFLHAKNCSSDEKDLWLDHANAMMHIYDTCQSFIKESQSMNAQNDIDFNAKQENELGHTVDCSSESNIHHENTSFSLRPYALDDYIGQENIKKRLTILIDAAKQRHEPLDHMLLYGSAGLGKTSLAQIISHEMNSHFIELNATSLTDVRSFANIISNIEDADILFIDEIHAIPSQISDMLLTILEDFKLTYIDGKGNKAQAITIPLKRFTFIGATTHPGLLSKPLLDRMVHKFKMEQYTIDELQTLIENICCKWGLALTDLASYHIAKRSRNVPRIAIQFVRVLRDYAQVHGNQELNEDMVISYFNELGIDDHGITEEDRRLLSIIIDRFQGGPVSLASLAHVMGDNENIIETHIEPYLIQQNLITVTKSGRLCTDDGRLYIQTWMNRGDVKDEFK